jgi:hypothetical protein
VNNQNSYSISLGIATVIASLVIGHSALADCAGASVSEVKRDFARAQTLEAQGKKEAALAAYVSAEEYTCDTNPVEAEAAKRAAALALPLGTAAEQRGDLQAAFQLYDAGGYYAKADAVLIAQLRAAPDDPNAFDRARSHFENRALPAFASNNAVRLKTVGAYQVNPKHVAEMLAMPAKGVERALQKESTLFNEQYLRELVQDIQSRPEPSMDMGRMQDAAATHQAFAQKWPDDLLKQSRDTLRTLRQWGSVTRDKDLAASVEKHFNQRIEHHIDALTQRYSGAPKLLDDAIDFVHMLNSDPAQLEPREAKIKSQAMNLGDAANAKQCYALASDYYGVAGDSAKAQAARDQLKKNAMAKMQPTIDDMQRQAEQLRAQYSDPAKVKAMQEQAEAMRKSLQQQQASAKQANKKSAGDLEKELGL